MVARHSPDCIKLRRPACPHAAGNQAGLSPAGASLGGGAAAELPRADLSRPLELRTGGKAPYALGPKRRDRAHREGWRGSFHMAWINACAVLGLVTMVGLGGCASKPQTQAGVDPATGLPKCNPRNTLPSGSNRPVQSDNSLPAGAKDLTPACNQGDPANRYISQ
jgi:hypothetical protein